jgi:GDP-L-fucose synthase
LVAGLIRRFFEAKAVGAPAVKVWGTGTPRRDFLYVNDLAEACVCVLERYSGEAPLNIGTGKDISIAELAQLVAEIADYRGKLVFDHSRPDGTPRKLLDTSKLDAMGWRSQTTLRLGLELAYADFVRRYKPYE